MAVSRVQFPFSSNLISAISVDAFLFWPAGPSGVTFGSMKLETI